MKKTTKFVALLMAMILAMGSMTACGSKDEGKTSGDSGNTTSENSGTSDTPVDVELTVWAPQEEQVDYTDVDPKYTSENGGLLGYMCDQFNEAHPEWNITFKYEVCSEADAKDNVTKDAAAAGDVFMYSGDQLASLVKAGVLLQLAGLDDVVANNGEKAMAAATVGDATYGIPFTPNTWFMYYDSSKYSEEEVKSLDTMMAKDLDGCKYNFAMDIDNGWYNGGFFYAAGCTTNFDDDKNVAECDFNSANGLAAANVMLDLTNNKKFLVDDDNNVALAEAEKGNCAAFTSGTWNAAKAKEAYGDNFAATKLPEITIDGKSVQLNSIGDYKYIGVNANTDNAAAAQALAIWLGSEQCQLDRFLARGISPTWASLAENADVAADAATSALAAQNQFTAVTPLSDKFNNNYWNAMAALGAGMINGEITADNLQDQLDKVVENIVTDIAK